jgi:hypothetical protein
MEVGKVQWDKSDILAGLFLELFDSSSTFLRISGSHVHLCVLVHHFLFDGQYLLLPAYLALALQDMYPIPGKLR